MVLNFHNIAYKHHRKMRNPSLLPFDKCTHSIFAHFRQLTSSDIRVRRRNDEKNSLAYPMLTSDLHDSLLCERWLAYDNENEGLSSWCICHISFQLNFLWLVSHHLHAPWAPICATLPLRCSFSWVLTSDRTIFLLSALLAVSHLSIEVAPRLSLPTVVVLSLSFNLS